MDANRALPSQEPRLDASANPLQLRGCMLIAAATLFWALSGIVAKFLFATRTFDPLVLVELRMLGSFVVLAVLLAIRAPSALRINPRHLGFFLVYGSAGMAMVQLSYFTAIREGSVSTAIFLQYLAPVLTAVYTVACLKIRPPAGLAGNLALAVAGSALLLAGGKDGLSTTPLGVAAGLSSAGFMSFYAVYGARGVGLCHPFTVLLYALAVGTLTLCPFFAPWRALSLGWTAADWLSVLYMAVFGTLIPFSLFLSGLRYVTPVQATLTAMLEPVLATFGSWLLLRESLGLVQVAGGGLIVAAVVRLQLARARGKAG